MAANVGQPAPDFTMPDQNRKPVTLSDLRGSTVVLAFYPGAFTGGCTREVCSLRDNMAQFNSVNAQVFGVSVDAPPSQKAWAEQHELNFPLLSDYKREVVKQYDVEYPNLLGLDGYVGARRSIFVIDKEGIVRYTWYAERDPIPPYDELNQVLSGL